MSGKVRGLIAAAAALLVVPLSGGPASAEKRVALVIGNGAYHNVARLPNPGKDAAAMEALFKNAGFDRVSTLQDVGKPEFARALREFAEAARDADTAVVYYAGHGLQLRETNYMIPVDAKLATESAVADEAIPLDHILAALGPAKRLRLVILDACRENPFIRRMKFASLSRAAARGLARVEPGNNFLVAYAAKNGQIALDGTGENSPFTAALVKHLPVPGLDVRWAFGRVRDDVLETTGHRQEPFVYGSLGGEAVALVPEPARPEPVADANSEYELSGRLATKKGWVDSLAKDQTGHEGKLAHDRLAGLGPTLSPPPPAAKPQQTVSLAPAAEPIERNEHPLHELDRRIAQNPNEADAYFKRGLAHARNGQYSRAIEDFDHAIRLNPKNADALNNRCWARAVVGDLLMALRDCNESLRLDPTFADALDSRGLVNLKMGIPDKAIANYNAALRLNPKHASALFGRGKAKLLSGDRAGGNADIAAATALNRGIAREFAAFGIK